uniref:CRISPR-associated helicase Cas3 n=1 Tax=Fervidobacterium pennivorans TaxID=93466 RepID=A0A7C4RZ59_FERPE
MEYFARPGQKLIEHLKNVAEFSVKAFDDIQISNKEKLKRISEIIAYFHDFGKYTTYFQEKLTGKSKASKLANHSYISAITLATYLLDEYEYGYLILPAFVSVFAHHSNLPDTYEEIPRIKAKDTITESNISQILIELNEPHSQRLKDLFRQYEDILKNFENIQKEYTSIAIQLKEEYFMKEKAVNVIQTLRRMLIKFEDEKEEVKEDIAFSTQLLYSVLIDADKKDAGGIQPKDRKNIPDDIVEMYIQKLRLEKNQMTEIREKLRKTTITSIKEEQLENLYGRILTITAPTGAGKTLAALNTAIRLRNRIQKEKGYTPRIIYSLPYISIVEQNLSVIESVLNQLPDYTTEKESYLTAHYHLAEMEETKQEEFIDYDKYDKMQLFIESWESEIIVTTFWQLLHTMIGYKNRLMKKFYKLSGSIVILDEVQTIPPEQWLLVEKFIELLSRKFSTIFILMTATQPMLLKEKSYELNKNFEVIFKKLNRTEIINLIDSTKTFEEIWEEIKEQEKNKSILLVCNSVSDSIEKYRTISRSEEETYYLSTNITPKDRFERIEEIKVKLRKNIPIILVSTQVVEAGVDLDFDVVIRELAPVHSIIQIAGRCNRNASKRKSKMYLLNTKESLAKKVYGVTAIETAKESILKYSKERIIPEKDYLELTKYYFNIIRERATKQSEADEIWKSYLNLKFQTADAQRAISEYRFIKEEPKVSIFVIKDSDDEEVFQIFKTILNENDKNKRARMFILNKRRIQERMIHINIERALKNLPPAIDYFDNLRFINKESLEIYYDLDTGFKYLEDEIKEQIIW